MDVSRTGRGEQVAALGGVVLIISLFLNWVGEVSGWEASTTTDVFLLITAVAGIATVLSIGDSLPLPGVTINGAAALLGIVATVLLLWWLVFDWPDGVDREFGIILALIASAAIAYGGWDSA
jgi:hypothetical protein